jgi:hypothetical protein
MRFNRLPDLTGVYGPLRGVPEEEVRTFPQVYRGSLDFVDSLGHTGLTEIAQKAMRALTQRWTHISIDTRLSMLVPGMYPCIPGWHVDDFWRPDGKNTDLFTVPEAEHLVVNLGDCSNTIFLDQPITIEIPTIEELAGKSVHAVIHEAVEKVRPNTRTANPGSMYRMYPTTIHRGEAARVRGWRYFFRLTGSNHRVPKNEIRTQSQVYVDNVARGW